MKLMFHFTGLRNHLNCGVVGTLILGGGGAATLAALPTPLGSIVELFIPPAFAGPRAIPLIGTFPAAAEPAGRANPPIAAEPACPPRANEAAGGVKTMNNAIATFTEVLDLDMGKFHVRFTRTPRDADVGPQSTDTIKFCFRHSIFGAETKSLLRKRSSHRLVAVAAPAHIIEV
jgi:hypothetical protein